MRSPSATWNRLSWKISLNEDFGETSVVAIATPPCVIYELLNLDYMPKKLKPGSVLLKTINVISAGVCLGNFQSNKLALGPELRVKP
jgi:hypothetical protein